MLAATIPALPGRGAGRSARQAQRIGMDVRAKMAEEERVG
jgi:hypothetical protein